MEITEVTIRSLVRDKTKTKAVVSIVIDDAFAVHNLRVVQGRDGLFVAMPSRKSDEGYQDIAHPVNNTARRQISDAVLAAYERETERTEKGGQGC